MRRSCGMGVGGDRPLIGYHLTNDCIAILADGDAHSPFIVKSFLTCLLGLTALQFYWLSEIVRRAPSEIRAALQKSPPHEAKKDA